MAELGDKYRVSRTEDGAPVDDAFVLRVRKDPVGWLAAWHYAKTTYNTELAEAMRSWLLENTPDESTLGTEGNINQEALGEVRKVVAAPQL